MMLDVTGPLLSFLLANSISQQDTGSSEIASTVTDSFSNICGFFDFPFDAWKDMPDEQATGGMFTISHKSLSVILMHILADLDFFDGPTLSEDPGDAELAIVPDHDNIASSVVIAPSSLLSALNSPCIMSLHAD